MSRIIKSIIAAFALSQALPAALAEPPFSHATESPDSVSVRLSDLNMSSISGGKTLLARIKSAARRVCGDSDAYSPLRTQSETVCRRLTIARAVAQLDINTLTLAFNEGKPLAAQLATLD